MNSCMDPQILRRLQLTELEMMCAIDRLCRDHGIDYFMVGGTLLGAERHKGFIPWDDDLDIGIPRKDYQRFINLCNEGYLGDAYYLQHTSSYADYFMPFAKVRKNNTLFDEASIKSIKCHKGIFIDVFPLDYINCKSGIIYHLRARVIKRLGAVIFCRAMGKKSSSVCVRLLSFVLSMFSITQLANFRDALCSINKSGKYLINYGSNYKYTKQTMEKEIYFPGVDLEFEGHMFRAPSKHIQYLVNLFGDWQKLPPEEKRRNHNPTTVVFDTNSEEIEE